jgi:DNA-binding transcriptional ArsR family regulator
VNDRDVFQAIADPTRRRLLDLLREGERTPGRLAAEFAVSRPAVSQHLRVLRRAGLLRERRVGRERHYRLRPGALQRVHEWLGAYAPLWEERLEALREHLWRNQ